MDTLTHNLPFDSWIANGVLVYAAIATLAYAVQFVTGPGFKVKGKHVFITGGSAGLGLAVAKEYAKAGALVTVVSRSKAKLEAAKVEISAVSAAKDAKGGGVHVIPTDAMKFEMMKGAVAESTAYWGQSVDHLVCCAGQSSTGYFAEQSIETLEWDMRLNYFGVLYAIKAALPGMVSSSSSSGGGSGRKIVIVSSATALTNFIGYTNYGATKYALRGLGDGLRNELCGHGIGVHMYFPANMATPGFEVENRTKPQETKDIEGPASLVSAESAAQVMVSGMRRGHFYITNDPLIEVARIGAHSVAPRNHPLFEFLLLPAAFFLQAGFRWWMDHVVKEATAASKKSKRS